MVHTYQQLNSVHPDPSESASGKIAIELASTSKEKEQVYRFRYQIYVREMAKELSTADHRRRLLIDDMDDWAIQFYARDGAEIVGSFRLHLGRCNDFPAELIEAFAMDRFTQFKPVAASLYPFAFSSKVMVAPHYRRSPVLFLLSTIVYRSARGSGTHFFFTGGAPSMGSFHEHTGFRRYKDNFTVPEYGYMIPQVLIAEDIEHFRRIRSPLWRMARKYENSPASAEWFAREFTEASRRYINKRLTDKARFWEILSEKLGQAPEKAIPLFDGLSEPEAQICANVGHLLNCRSQDVIVHPYNINEEIFVVLSGLLTAKKQLPSGRKIINSLSPGQSFGEHAFANNERQNTTITAQTDAELLVLSGYGITQLEIQHPVVAMKLWRNIARTYSELAMYA